MKRSKEGWSTEAEGGGETGEKGERKRWWRFGKRTVEKPLDSYERQNSTESRHTDRRWLRLTGFASSLPFLPYWSFCSLVVLYFPPLLRSLVLYSLATSFSNTCASATALLFITYDLQA